LCPGADVPATAPNRATTAGPATVSTDGPSSACYAGTRWTKLVMAHYSGLRAKILNLVALCRQTWAIRVSLVPQPYELLSIPSQPADLGGLPLLQLGEMPPASGGPGKRLLDLAAGFVSRLATLTFLLACAAALRCTAGHGFRWKDASAGKARSFPCCGSRGHKSAKWFRF